MNYTTENVQRGGTHLQGYVAARFSQLVRAFGIPEDGDGYKTRVEWAIEFDDGTIATIYDWKSDQMLDDITEWNVGGFIPKAVEKVEWVLNDRGFNV